ncbi:hypothetical protein SBRCBS47491_009615 [Sporothrix bragantina]|uniref:Uncharacterized protein n=1 Tax=Sporothrix bragantina TaxID=671064 RepID=A0ABP0CXT6_9PEZI
MSSKERQKSEKLDKNAPGVVTLNVSPDKLRAIFPNPITSNTFEHEPENTSPSTPLPAKDGDDSDVKPSHKDDNASESTPATPQGNTNTTTINKETTADTPQSSAMAPPHATTTDEDGGEAAKKKGVKRSAAAAGVDGTASAGPGSANGDTPAPAVRVRSKPGPKKKAKLDDGVEIRASAAGAHKLGPKASMGAINAGLRALDRSGKPCRKWIKGGFQLKSFTGVQWEIPRWRAPPKFSGITDDSANGTGEESASAATPSADGSGSNKENGGSGNSKDKDGKTNGEAKTNGHTNGVNDVNGETATATPSDVEMTNAPTSGVASPSVEPATEAATPVAAAA